MTFLESMEVKYFSVKNWLPLNAAQEQIETFKAKCKEYDVNSYILGIYIKSESEADRVFAYAERYGAKIFIGVPKYELTDYIIKRVA